MSDPVRTVPRRIWRGGEFQPGERVIPDEVAVALTYNGGTLAVMMATPSDLADFALGFSLTEGVIATAAELESCETVVAERGIEMRMWLSQAPADRLAQRRRHLAGPTGCGLCGIDSLDEALRTVSVVGSRARFTPGQVMQAVAAVPALQTLNHQTRALHAAALWTPSQGIVALREDVGRHNALDKLAGALARVDADAGSGMIVLTSRVSVEMVQKAAAIGAGVIVAVSAPTALAVRVAEAAGIAIAAIARADGFEVFTRPHRIAPEASSDVA